MLVYSVIQTVVTELQTRPNPLVHTHIKNFFKEELAVADAVQLVTKLQGEYGVKDSDIEKKEVDLVYAHWRVWQFRVQQDFCESLQTIEVKPSYVT